MLDKNVIKVVVYLLDSYYCLMKNVYLKIILSYPLIFLVCDIIDYCSNLES